MAKISNYDFFKENEGVLFESIKRGLMPLTIMDRIVIYEYYQAQLKKVPKLQAVYNCCTEFNIKSLKTIYNCINMLERN